MQYADAVARNAALEKENERHKRRCHNRRKAKRLTTNDEAKAQYSQQQAQTDKADCRREAFHDRKMTEAHVVLLSFSAAHR